MYMEVAMDYQKMLELYLKLGTRISDLGEGLADKEELKAGVEEVLQELSEINRAF